MEMDGIHFIHATDSCFGFSKNGKIPWNDKEDMTYFKQTTMGNAVVMGRKTWESLPIRPLPGRINIILTRNKDYNINETDTYVFNDIIDVLKFKRGNKKLFVIGGLEIFDEFEKLGMVNYRHSTMIGGEWKCDKTYKWNFNDDMRIVEIGGKRTVYGYCNSEERQLIDLFKMVIEKGKYKDMRANKALSIFSPPQLEFKLYIDGYIDTYRLPVTTHRHTSIKCIFTELMWILYGETDSNLLKERCGVNVWEGNTTREFLDSRGLHWLPEGDIGASYGYQMRKFGSSDITKNKTIEDKSKVNEGFDQLKECIRLIKEEPNSNRIIINLWNPLQLDMMSLPPCGFCYQFDVEDFEGIKRLNCKVTQRSSDVLLAGGWNITSASLFTILLSRECGIYPGRVIWSPGNVHIYENNIKEAKEIIKNFVDENTTLFQFPLLKLTEKSLFDYTFSDLNIINYQYYPKINLNFNV